MMIDESEIDRELNALVAELPGPDSREEMDRRHRELGRLLRARGNEFLRQQQLNKTKGV